MVAKQGLGMVETGVGVMLEMVTRIIALSPGMVATVAKQGLGMVETVVRAGVRVVTIVVVMVAALVLKMVGLAGPGLTRW